MEKYADGGNEKKELRAKKTALLEKIKPVDAEFYEVVTVDKNQNRPAGLLDRFKKKITWSDEDENPDQFIL